LTKGASYYVQVYAINSAGVGTSQASSPTFAIPDYQIPGIPHTLSAATGTSVGEIDVSWIRPQVPWHEIPCSGVSGSPNSCPTNFGGSVPISNGGRDIDEYEIEYNEREDFTGADGGIVTTTTTAKTLSDLTPGRMYYIRVLARNTVGSGAFCEEVGTNCVEGAGAVSAVALS